MRHDEACGMLAPPPPQIAARLYPLGERGVGCRVSGG